MTGYNSVILRFRFTMMCGKDIEAVGIIRALFLNDDVIVGVHASNHIFIHISRARHRLGAGLISKMMTWLSSPQ